MAAHSYDDLLSHVGHSVSVVTYGPYNDPANVAIECEDCGVVLLDFDKLRPVDPADLYDSEATDEERDAFMQVIKETEE